MHHAEANPVADLTLHLCRVEGFGFKVQGLGLGLEFRV